MKETLLKLAFIAGMIYGAIEIIKKLFFEN